jgi:hypothetical protein
MKRSRSIRLVLLGGGVMLGLAACGESEQERLCRLARAENRPDAEQLCARSRATSSSSGGGYGSWYYGRTGAYGGAYGRSQAADGRSAFTGRTATSTVSRSGFGSTGARSGGG